MHITKLKLGLLSVTLSFFLFSCSDDEDNYPLEGWSSWDTFESRYIYNFHDFHFDVDSYKGIIEINTFDSKIEGENRVFMIESMFNDKKEDRTYYIDYINYNGEASNHYQSITYLSHYFYKRNYQNDINNLEIEFSIDSKIYNFTYHQTNTLMNILETNIKLEDKIEIKLNGSYDTGRIRFSNIFDTSDSIVYLDSLDNPFKTFKDDKVTIRRNEVLEYAASFGADTNNMKSVDLELSTVDTTQFTQNKNKFIIFSKSTKVINVNLKN